MSEAGALLRSALMARVIGGDELGRTMILTLVLRLAEMLSDAGVERFLMHRPDGVTPGLLAALHGAALVRGMVAGAFLLALSLPPLWADRARLRQPLRKPQALDVPLDPPLDPPPAR